MSAKLKIAVPSKGRIMEGVYGFFADAGLPLKKTGGARDYVGRMSGIEDVEIIFMSSSEIAGSLYSGAVHLGVTGEDLMQEAARGDMSRTIALVKPLGFGGADVVVAVPQSWIDVRGMSDLKEVAQDFRARHQRPLRVATKYLNLTRAYFAANGIVDYRIVESAGATEGAPAAGTAELIVDITSTGATLSANSLKILDDGVILRSQAQLAASLKARWTKGAHAALAHILEMVAAKDAAAGTSLIRFQMKKKLGVAQKALVDKGCVVVKSPPTDGEVQCPEEALHDIVQILRKSSATGITVTSPDYIFAESNPLAEALESRLS